MTQLTPVGLVRILGQVTVILAVPIVGGAVAGIILDRMYGTSPLLFLGGFGAGNLLAFTGIGLFIRSGQRRLRGPAQSGQPKPVEPEAGPVGTTGPVETTGPVATTGYDDA